MLECYCFEMKVEQNRVEDSIILVAIIKVGRK